MRKRQISPTPPSVPPSGQAWLDVEPAALVEVTSEENGYPIESALLDGLKTGAGVRRIQGRRQSGSFLTSHKPSDVSGWFSRIARIHARRSSCCDGLLTVEILFEKSFASSGISVRPSQCER